jgi:SAM-dependent methyltransferase
MADYGKDLAYIHDQGFLGLAEQATPVVVKLLAERGVDGGRVVELGSGSGATARALTDAGHDVLGIDASRAMVELARTRAPAAHFRVGSWAATAIPDCDAVIAIGEVLGYVGSARGSKNELEDLFGRVRTALSPGGVFIFDLAIPGRVPGGEDSAFRVGDDWAILYTANEAGSRLQRRITTFRRIGGGATYRRTEEIHRLRLWHVREIDKMLREAHFRVQVRRGYGGGAFAPGHRVFIARAA